MEVLGLILLPPQTASHEVESAVVCQRTIEHGMELMQCLLTALMTHGMGMFENLWPHQ
jgi:hypothetical protein